nr:unnamed protein product [Digitaria exilis]
MSAGAGAGGHGGLYGDPAAADHFAAAFDDHHDSFFFQRSPPCAGGGGGGGGDELMMTPYSSITDYLQGFLDPAGMASHLDAPCRVGDEAVKQEMEARLSRHEREDGPAAAGAPATPNSSVLSSSSGEAAGGADEEPRHRCKKGRLEEDEEGQEEIDAEGSAAADRNCK